MSASLFSKGALLLIDKPEGITSHDAVERARRATGEIKIGHTGTLDPMASGLLMLCTGRAARLQAFFTGLSKSYQGEMTLGRATDTYDREGETIFESPGPVHVSAEDVEREAGRFRGEFDQAPPPFSAKKVGGRKFYELARRGEAVPAVAKRVTVSALKIELVAADRLRFSLDCSSGTYVRSIAHEMGSALGCGAHLSQLRRSRIGDFDIRDSVTLAQFEEMTDDLRVAPPKTIPLSRIPFPFPRMTVAALEASKLQRGQPVPARVDGVAGQWVALESVGGELIALGQVSPIGTGRIAMIRPRIVLAEQGKF